MKPKIDNHDSRLIKVDFGSGKVVEEDIFPEDMNAGQLREYISALKEQLAELDALEPADEESEEYESWADEHEELEDVIDEALDLLDELE